MSRTRLGKKLQPAKKAWKNFSNTVQYKFHKLNIQKSIKITLQHLLSIFHSLKHLIHTKTRRSLATTRPYATPYYHVQHKNFAAIRIDDLFAESASAIPVHATYKGTHAQESETSRGKELPRNNNENLSGVGESSGLNTIEDAWKVVVARSPQLQVDQKAEEFISKFREDMRLQKERSMLEFQEMLARGT